MFIYMKVQKLKTLTAVVVLGPAGVLRVVGRVTVNIIIELYSETSPSPGVLVVCSGVGNRRSGTHLPTSARW